jgi:hypothetical protein
MDQGTAFTKFVLENQDKDASNGLIGVEVGVRDGRNALDLCRFLNIQKLYLVDDFVAYQDGSAREYTQEDQELELQKLVKNTDHVFNKTVLIRQSSKLARDIFPIGIFDFIYIDGNHAYESVKDDLLWFNHVKEFGIIGGHDYGGFDGDEVKKAVDEFSEENKLEIIRLGGRVRIPPDGAGGVEWAIIKPGLGI